MTSRNFRYFDGVTSAQIDAIPSKPRKALSEAQRLSLVNTSKCPTQKKAIEKLTNYSTLEPIQKLESLSPKFESINDGSGLYTLLQFQEWSGEYRIRTRVETSLRKPPPQSGKRRTSRMSQHGVKRIFESCKYVARCRGGYQTFVTGTFSPQTRNEIVTGETTIQREISRTMDSLSKMYLRGWLSNSRKRISGIEKPFCYCWVIEIPKNSEGFPNPHIHMLMNWKVPKDLFLEWSSRIEQIWGNGYFHLEKIREPNFAGSYIAKAAKYLTKSDQGVVYGNRYGISRAARAPEFVTFKEAELGIMGRLITDCFDSHLEQFHDLYEKRHALKNDLRKAYLDDRRQLKQLRSQLNKVSREFLNLPVKPSRYQIIFRTTEAFYQFLDEAAIAGWDLYRRPRSRWLAEFDKERKRRKTEALLRKMRWTDIEWSFFCKNIEKYQHTEPGEFPNSEYKYYSEHCFD